MTYYKICMEARRLKKLSSHHARYLMRNFQSSLITIYLLLPQCSPQTRCPETLHEMRRRNVYWRFGATTPGDCNKLTDPFTHLARLDDSLRLSFTQQHQV